MLTNKTLAAALAVATIAGATLLSPTNASAGGYGYRSDRSDFGYGYRFDRPGYGYGHKFGFGHRFGRPSFRFGFGHNRFGGWH